MNHIVERCHLTIRVRNDRKIHRRVLGFVDMGLVKQDEKQFKIKKEGIKRICGYFLMEEYDQRIDY